MGLFQAGNLPVINRRYSLIVLKQINENEFSRFSNLRKSVKCSKPCLANTLKDLIQNNYVSRVVYFAEDKKIYEGYICTRKAERFLREFYENQFKENQRAQDLYISLVEMRTSKELEEGEKEKLRKFYRIRIEETVQEAIDRFHLHDLS